MSLTNPLLRRAGFVRTCSERVERFVCRAQFSRCPKRTLLWTFALWTLLSISAASPIPAASLSLRSPLEFRTWTIEQSGVPEVRVSSWSLPWVSTVGLSSRSSLVLSGRGSATHLSRPDRSREDLSELTAQIRQEVARWPLTWMVSVTAPGSGADLSPEDADLREWRNHPLLGLRRDRNGRGVDIGAAAILAPGFGTSGRWAFGLGLELPGSYSLGGLPDYQPGEEFSASLGFEWTRLSGSGERFVVRLTGRTFGRDDLGSAEGIREGNQADATARWLRRFGNWQMQTVSQISWKAKTSQSDAMDRLADPAGWLAAGDLSFVYAASRMKMGMTAETRRFGGNETGPNQGWSMGVGPTASAGNRLTAQGECLYLRARWEDGRAKASGVSARLAVSVSL